MLWKWNCERHKVSSWWWWTHRAWRGSSFLKFRFSDIRTFWLQADLLQRDGFSLKPQTCFPDRRAAHENVNVQNINCLTSCRIFSASFQTSAEDHRASQKTQSMDVEVSREKLLSFWPQWIMGNMQLYVVLISTHGASSAGAKAQQSIYSFLVLVLSRLLCACTLSAAEHLLLWPADKHRSNRLKKYIYSQINTSEC